MNKLIRVSVNVNGRKALDSKPCATLIEAMNNLVGKVQRYESTSGKRAHAMNMVVGRRSDNQSKEFEIAKDLHPEARQLVPALFPDSNVSVSDHGIW
jgi:hypothetical protein